MKISGVTNLTTAISQQLPAELVNFIQLAGEVAQSRGQKLYLVGGVVRDLFLGRATLDLDLVLEGDAISLAQQLGLPNQAKIKIHTRFGTAKLKWQEWSVDIATARSETYAKPGALPSVTPGSIRHDLFRRDFTINAMAVKLNPGRYGEVLDPYGGRGDLEDRLIRVLHEKSFLDDATRIWRGIRYEQRLDFQLEPATLKLLKRDVPMLDTISGDRIRHELELVLREEYPEKALRRADELGVLSRMHPSLKGNGWLAEKFEQARKQGAPGSPPTMLYLALLAYHLTDEEIEQLITYLRLPKTATQTLRDTISVKAQIHSLADPSLSPSRIHSLLRGYATPAITANLLATTSEVVRKHIQLFLDKLRFIRPALNGEDLKRLGITSGQRIGEILRRLHEARLDGKVSSRKDEEEMVRRTIRTQIGSKNG